MAASARFCPGGSFAIAGIASTVCVGLKCAAEASSKGLSPDEYHQVIARTYRKD